jgi:hypothetical protein
MRTAKKGSRGGAKGFKLVPKAGVRPILTALHIKSVRVEGKEMILHVKSPGTVGDIVRIPMGKRCTFSSSTWTLAVAFKKVNPAS